MNRRDLNCYTQPISPSGKNGMSEKIVNIEEAKPHLTVNCGETIHVIPVALIEDVIAGKKDFTQLDDWETLLKTILRDWLDSI